MRTRSKDEQRDYLYHINCEAWYVTAAAKLQNPKLKARALANAKYHSDQATHIQQTTSVR